MWVFTAVITALAWFKLPETHQPSKEHHLTFSQIWRNNKRVLTTPAYMLPVLGMGLLWSMIITFSIVGPFLLQSQLHLSSTEYGYCALLIGVGIMIGNYINTRLHKIFQTEQILQMSVVLMLLIALIQFFLLIFTPLHLMTLMAPILLLMIMNGILFPSYYALAASVFTTHVGTASSLIGCLILLAATLCSAIITKLQAHSAITLSAVLLSLSLACFVINLARRSMRNTS